MPCVNKGYCCSNDTGYFVQSILDNYNMDSLSADLTCDLDANVHAAQSAPKSETAADVTNWTSE